MINIKRVSIQTVGYYYLKLKEENLSPLKDVAQTNFSESKTNYSRKHLHADFN